MNFKNTIVVGLCYVDFKQEYTSSNFVVVLSKKIRLFENFLQYLQRSFLHRNVTSSVAERLNYLLLTLEVHSTNLNSSITNNQEHKSKPGTRKRIMNYEISLKFS